MGPGAWCLGDFHIKYDTPFISCLHADLGTGFIIFLYFDPKRLVVPSKGSTADPDVLPLVEESNLAVGAGLESRRQELRLRSDGAGRLLRLVTET